MNMLLSSVSWIGLGPSACGMGTLRPSPVVTSTGSTRSRPDVISSGIALQAYVNSSFVSWNSTNTATLMAMNSSVQTAGPRPGSFWSPMGSIWPGV